MLLSEVRPRQPAVDQWAAVRRRITAVDQAFGDPWDENNPLGFSEILSADERESCLPAALETYDAQLLNAEFVPAALGGRLVGMDTAGALLRPVFRRDARLGAIGCISSLLAASVVWAAGSEAQRRRTADALLGGGRLAIACHQLEHANIFFQEEFRARPAGGGYLLSGRKPAINNLDRAELILAFASGPDGHSLFLLDRERLPGPWMKRLGGAPTGWGGMGLGGLELLECPVPASALVGGWGRGVEVGASAYPLMNATIAAMLIGLGDTALRVTLRFAAERSGSGSDCGSGPGSRSGSGLARSTPAQVRTAVNGAFVDLLIADCLTLTATRSLHLVPEQCDVLTAAAKYLVPKVLSESMHHLSTILGDGFHTTAGPSALVRKHLRDIDTISFGHVGSAVCQTAIVPFLPLLARDSDARSAQPEPALFRPGTTVPALDPDRLAQFGGGDRLWGYLSRAVESGELGPAGTADELGDEFAVRATAFAAELADVMETATDLGFDTGDPVDDPRAIPLSERYTLLLAAASCLGVWREAAAAPADDPGAAFLADPAWLLLALDRLLRRLGRPVPAVPAEAMARVHDELRRRADGARAFDLYAAELAG
ncbi:acyl-CoA dehydrogenase [Streptomyces sp. YIM 98790]|uniref:acyl-CoA dehydrogenase n=1 Tax=Streptomyces sp. YIM 98790 TaxID=2689077 RepID=UPI00140C4B9E|nr:acyl-CoA dehydrogenase [Streptomyces sp. YIM 98790]